MPFLLPNQQSQGTECKKVEKKRQNTGNLSSPGKQLPKEGGGNVEIQTITLYDRKTQSNTRSSTISNDNQLMVPGHRQHKLEVLGTEHMTDSGLHSCRCLGSLPTLSARDSRQL